MLYELEGQFARLQMYSDLDDIGCRETSAT